jgi:hypothetical protein
MACLSRGLVLVCVVALGLVLGACPPPPTMSDESPGQSDCGMLDPNVVLGNKLCPDQRSLIRNEGKPMGVKLGPGGGMTWSYEFHSGDVFGQRGGYRMYDFSPQGKLVKKREEFLYRQEK